MPSQVKQNNNQEITFFAQTNFRNQRRKFGIKRDDRRRHMYVIGKTGMGKSEMLANMIVQDIKRGHGVGVVDPHGELAEKLLDYIPSYRVNDVVYFNPADLNHPIAFNILENVGQEYKHLIASGLMGVFTKIWANMWSARMEYILNNCILALLDSAGNTLLGINRLLVDKEYRKKIISKVKDPVVKSFWVNEYANYNERFRTEAIAPIQNKVGQFLSSAIIRNIVGQTKSTLDMREIMDSQKILIMNLSKGKIGEDNSALLGAMMITKLQLAAMSRVNIPEEERKDFYLYVDEFQNFATDSFADILSEARKYRLNLILAHQYIAQLTNITEGARNTKVKDAVFGNVGTLVSFRVGAADAEELEREFEPYFTVEDMVNLAKYDIYLKLMIDGTASRPFSATTLLPMSEGEFSGNMDKIIKVSRERYSKPREIVEEKIARWSGLVDEEVASSQAVAEEEEIYRHDNQTSSSQLKTEKKEPATKEESKEDSKLEAICDNCGKETRISFIPDEFRNVFCKACLKKFKKGEINPNLLPKRNIQQSTLTKPAVVPPQQSSARQGEIKPSGANSSKTGEEVNSHRQTNQAVTLPVGEEISLSEALKREPVPFHQRKSIVGQRAAGEPLKQYHKVNEVKKSQSQSKVGVIKPGETVNLED